MPASFPDWFRQFQFSEVCSADKSESSFCFQKNDILTIEIERAFQNGNIYNFKILIYI